MNNIKISGDLDMTFDRMAREMPAVEESALKAGAYCLKEKVKDTFKSKFPAATRPVRAQTGKGGYPINSGEPLIDAVMQTKAKNESVKVHALGAGKANSSLFIARFYEGVTKPRYQKTYKGRRMKKKRSTGVVGGTFFFTTAISSYMEQVFQKMSEIINNKLSKITNGQ